MSLQHFRYTVDANVHLDTSVAVVSKISVDPDVIVVPQFKNPPLQAIPAEEHFQVMTIVSNDFTIPMNLLLCIDVYDPRWLNTKLYCLLERCKCDGLRIL